MSVSTARNQKGFSREVFARRLKIARLARNLTQEQLGRKAGLQASSVCKFESADREPTVVNLYALAIALCVTVDYLVGNVPNESNMTFKDLTDKDICIIERMREFMLEYNKEEKEENG